MSKTTELSTQELLAIVEKDSSVITNLKDDKTNVKDFLREYCITDGPALVPGYKIYHDYTKLWNPGGKKISKISFFRTFNKVFKMQRTSTTRCYKLNIEVFDLSNESLEIAKKFDERYRKRITKRNKKNNWEPEDKTKE